MFRSFAGPTCAVLLRVVIMVVAALSISIPVFAAQRQSGADPASNEEQSNTAESPAHLSEELRASIDKLVVIAGPVPANREITGSYEKKTPGLVGGMDAGARATTISKDIGGVPVDFPIPVLTMPARIIGGISGTAMREIQDFRDALTEDLAQAADQPLTNDGLATDVYFALLNVPNLDTKLFAPTTPLPSDTDAILYVNVEGVTIDVQGKQAILTTSAAATLHRMNDNRTLYETTIVYQDRDTLSNWTKNENSLWRVYANFARHYLGREISADVFDRVLLRHELTPKESDSVARLKRNQWQGVTRSTTPTLAWELELLGEDSYGAWADSIDESNILYDIEIYDMRELVYAENQVPTPFHTLAWEIEPCKTYRWSVRPTYHIGSSVKFGEWMRKETKSDRDDETAKGIIGRKASDAPAYVQDFASLKVECSRR